MSLPTALRSPAARRSILAGAIAAAAIWLFVAKASHRMPDFEVYWRAGARAAHAEALYRPGDYPYEFKYFPAFAMLAVPIGMLPLGVAKAVWFGLAVAALVTLLRLAPLVVPDRRIPAWLLVGGLIVGLGKYYGQELVLGQINLFLAVVVTGVMLAAARGHQALAGVLVALAVAIKPYALILLPWVAARRQAATIVAAVAGMLLAFLLPAAAYGLAGTVALHAAWWAAVRDSTASTLVATENVSLASMFTKWFGPTAAAAWATALTALALLAAAAVVVRRRKDVARPDGLEAALLIALTPLLSPQGWGYVFVVATPAMAYVLNYAGTLPPLARWGSLLAIAAIGLNLYDLLGRRLHYLLVGVGLPTLALIVVIAALVALRLRRTA